MIKFLLSICITFSLAVQARTPKERPVVFSIDAKALEKNKARIKAKDESMMHAYKQLVKDADKALQYGPVSVMEKKNVPPSGDKHDYMSLAPYHWPDPSKPNGLPYMRKDGETNPEVKEYKDKEYMPKLCEIVQTLALAYYFTENKAYAQHASKLLEVWFVDTATRMNPNLNYAQAIKGVNNGRGAGMIDARHLIKVVDAVGILQTSGEMKKNTVKSLKSWFSDFLHWMQTSENGMDEMDAPNNHGAWYDAQRLSFALFVDSMDLAKRIVLNAQTRLDKQMNDEGDFPKEMERTTSLHYTTFALEAFFHIATMAEHTGIDFWNAVTPSGKSLKKGFDKLYPYLTGEKKWEGQQIKEFDFEEGYKILQDAGKNLNCKRCFGDVKQLAGDKWFRLRLQLLY